MDGWMDGWMDEFCYVLFCYVHSKEGPNFAVIN